MRPTVTLPAAFAGAAPPALLYAAFALLATAINLGTQAIAAAALARWAGAALPASLVCGTGAGFVAKYLLDKHLVFHDRSTGLRDEARKVGLSGVFSLATTLLFWGCEIAAWHIGGTAGAKYAGAVVGIALGYAAKFLLDRRFTFTGAGAALTSPAPADGRRASRPSGSAWPSWSPPAGRRAGGSRLRGSRDRAHVA